MADGLCSLGWCNDKTVTLLPERREGAPWPPVRLRGWRRNSLLLYWGSMEGDICCCANSDNKETGSIIHSLSLPPSLRNLQFGQCLSGKACFCSSTSAEVAWLRAKGPFPRWCNQLVGIGCQLGAQMESKARNLGFSLHGSLHVAGASSWHDIWIPEAIYS